MISSAGDGHDVAFTSDGLWAYLVDQNRSTGFGAVMIFQRSPTTGALSQLAGTAGCITSNGSDQDGAGQCQNDATLDGPDGISISSDNRFVYVNDYNNNTIHTFSRNTTTGALTEVQCLAEASRPVTGCTNNGRVLGDSEFLALSPDGMHAYSGNFGNGISVFDRDPSTGLLTQKAGTAGCVTDRGHDQTGATTCAVGRNAAGNYPILIAPNGQTLYDVDGSDGGFSVFHINGDGTLAQLSGTAGCVTINGNDNTGASTCATGRAVTSPYGGAISPDGNALYVSDDTVSEGGLAVFSLNPSTGAAAQLPGLQGCITTNGDSNGTANQCVDGTALSYGYGMTVSPDGTSVYQATDDSSNAGLAVYRREAGPVCQPVGVATGYGAAVTVPLACVDADGDAVTRAAVAGPAHGSLSAVNNAAGTVTYTPATGFHGTDTFTFAASDGLNSSVAATATVTVGAPPTLSKLKVSPKRFSIAGRNVKGRCVKPTTKNAGAKHCRLAVKLRVSYSLSAATTVTFTVKRQIAGRKVGGLCVKQTSKNKKHGKCTGFVSVPGKMVRLSPAGSNHFNWNGKIGGRLLGTGTYELIATPPGGTSAEFTFTIVD